MGIAIDHITAKNLGPLQELDTSLSRLNLIYSPNEGGKTHLTEFIIRCLFQQNWANRGSGTGKVWLSGLAEEALSFTPSTSQKLEDYLDTQHSLPPTLAKLLVVKGASPEIADTHTGIDQSTLRTLLSEQKRLDNILNSISKTVQKAEIRESTIAVDKKGAGKTYQELQQSLSAIDEYIHWLNQNFVTGRISDLKQQEAETREAIEQQNQAKRYEAYQTAQSLSEIQQQLRHYDPATLTNLERDIQNYTTKNQSLAQTREALDRARKAADYYHWLASLKERYQTLQEQVPNHPHKGWLVAIVISFLAGIGFLLIDNTPVAGLFFTGMAAFTGIVLWQYRQLANHQADLKAYDNLQADFKEKTGRPLHTVADIDAVMYSYKEAPAQVTWYEQQYQELRETLQNLFTHIQQQFRYLAGETIAEADWQSQLNALKTKVEELKASDQDLRDRLTTLGVDSSDYLADKPSEAYSQEQAQQLAADLQEIQQTLSEEEDQLTSIKSEIGAMVGENLVGSDFPDAYDKLLAKREATQAALQDLKARFVADMTVTQTINDMKAEEDQTIDRALHSESLTRPLRQLTPDYHGLVLDEEGQVIVKGSYQDFPLADLSTGAQEQVLLAIRAGLAGYLLQQDTLFFLLDDAFQHTDWQRRPAVIRYLAGLAKSGWQITYLTMDDHIRDWFDKIGNEELGQAYQKISLNP